eukprot:m.177316 g.177316  ORF g.177316 m.177316 type:complete len:288 (-) comp24478_c1_seq1:2812-3675(-)
MRLSDERWTAAAILVCVYAIFIVWFCGFPMAPIPLTEVDAEEYRDSFKGKVFEDEIAAHEFETFMSNDDGRPITVTAKLLFRDELKYPENTPANLTKRATIDEALTTLSWGLYMSAIPRGAVTMSAGNTPTTLFRSIEHTVSDDEDESEDEDGEGLAQSGTVLQKWSQEWSFRFRCRKDLLDVLLEAESGGVWWHKLAAVRAVDLSVSQGSVGYHMTPTVMIQLLFLFGLLIIYEMTEFFFPESPDMTELKKLRKRVKKLEGKLEKKKEGTATPSRAASGDEAAAST